VEIDFFHAATTALLHEYNCHANVQAACNVHTTLIHNLVLIELTIDEEVQCGDKQF
jgi:hypothetical protein